MGHFRSLSTGAPDVPYHIQKQCHVESSPSITLSESQAMQKNEKKKSEMLCSGRLFRRATTMSRVRPREGVIHGSSEPVSHQLAACISRRSRIRRSSLTIPADTGLGVIVSQGIFRQGGALRTLSAAGGAATGKLTPAETYRRFVKKLEDTRERALVGGGQKRIDTQVCDRLRGQMLEECIV